VQRHEEVVDELDLGRRAEIAEIQAKVGKPGNNRFDLADGIGAAESDYIVQLLGTWNAIGERYQSDLSDETHALLDGYAAGFNLYAAQHRSTLLPGVAPATTGPTVSATFLGVTTLLIGDGKTAFMTDGFFTRPGLFQVMRSKIAPDAAIVDRSLERAGVRSLAAVEQSEGPVRATRAPQVRDHVHITARHEEVTCPGFDEADGSAQVLDLARIGRSRDQSREATVDLGSDHVGEQPDAVTQRDRDIVVSHHLVLRLRKITKVPTCRLRSVQPALAGFHARSMRHGVKY